MSSWPDAQTVNQDQQSSWPDLQTVLAKKREELTRLQGRRQERNSRRAVRASSPVRSVNVNDILKTLDIEEGLVNVDTSPIKLFDGGNNGETTGEMRQATGRAAQLQAEVQNLTTQLANAKREIYSLKDNISYTKTTQTVQTDPWESEEKQVQEEEIADEQEKEENDDKKEDTHQEDDEDEVEETPPVKEYNPQEINEITTSYDFIDFMERASRLTDRCLHHNKKYDPLQDYAGGHDTDDKDKSDAESVEEKCTFFDERWSAGRSVTSMDWSPFHPELIAASYNVSHENPNDPDGIVMVWNTEATNRPEYVFNCESAVMSVSYSPFRPNILIGGTYSGQIVAWDKRARKTPVQRTFLSSEAHSHPVYSLDVIGTQNAHTMVSISTDGMACSWNLDMMNEPTESFELIAQSKPAGVTAMSFPVGDINNFVVGTEDGSLYQASRHNAKAGIGEAFQGHAGPVTGVDFHSNSTDFSHLFLSSSTDWSVKLWSYRQTKPIVSFENSGDYIYDVQWNPRHPAVFASADGMGNLDFWNITQDSEVPQVTKSVNEGKSALNRLKWSADGRNIAVADGDGGITVFAVPDRLCMPRLDETARFKTTLQDLQDEQDEQARNTQ